ncbi:MAG: 50S ribosomal protein L25 [Acidobacteriota bacterium]|nr:MAG: 50S ribosomal protein L25 [Acidobacteriota bacterium]
MPEHVTIDVNTRETSGKNEARRLRRSGRIPAVIYGAGRESVGIELDPRTVEAVLDSELGLNTLIQLSLEGRDLRRLVMIRAIQRDPTTDKLLHADFCRVELDKPVDVSVPVELVGTPLGVKNEGGLIEYVHREVTVRVLPDRIPEHLAGDVSELHIGQHLEAKDLELPQGVELLTAPTETIITVIGRAVVEEPVAEVAEAAEAAEVVEGAEEAAQDKDAE